MKNQKNGKATYKAGEKDSHAKDKAEDLKTTYLICVFGGAIYYIFYVIASFGNLVSQEANSVLIIVINLIFCAYAFYYFKLDRKYSEQLSEAIRNSNKPQQNQEKVSPEVPSEVTPPLEPKNVTSRRATINFSLAFFPLAVSASDAIKRLINIDFISLFFAHYPIKLSAVAYVTVPAIGMVMIGLIAYKHSEKAFIEQEKSLRNSSGS